MQMLYHSGYRGIKLGPDLVGSTTSRLSHLAILGPKEVS